MPAQDFVPVADIAELSEGEMKPLQLDGRRLLLVHAEGHYYVIDEMCTHEDYSLALGCIKGRRIKCSLHGSYFDLATGEPEEEPADEPVCSYRVEVADGKIWVNPEKLREGASTRCRR